MKICIVTPDLLGTVRNGGIGTACTFLAEALAVAGHRVSVLFTQCGTSANTDDGWMARYRARGVEVVVAEAWQTKRRTPVFPAHAPLKMAHAVHDWLAEHAFDVVFFMEWQGNGFYALQAKRAGLRFQDSVFVTVIHSPSLWHAMNNADLCSDPLTSLTYFMERKSVEWADAVVSPSAYMLDWVRRYGFNPPARSLVLPNLIEVVGEQQVGGQRTELPVNELVFFGRLEYRKGLKQFCDAIDRLANSKSQPTMVTFLGKFSRMADEHSAFYIARRSSKWSFPTQIRSKFDQSEANRYLQGPGRIAVMPSVADNSPYTVYECLVAGIPFLARDVGGVSELINPDDHSVCLFDDNPNSLSKKLEKALNQGAHIPRLAFDLSDNRMKWGALISDLIKSKRPRVQLRNALPSVSVCLTHYNRPKLLKQAVDSLLAQDYPNFEVILVDDGSTHIDAATTLDSFNNEFKKRGWKVLRQPNGYLGKARNNAVKQAKGDYLLFMDDDNVARPQMISRFVQAAVSTPADLVTAMFDVFYGDSTPTDCTPVIERFLPAGDIVSFSVVANSIGDSNSLIRRGLYTQLGGFTEDYGIGHEDFELYLRAVLAGAKVSVVPEPLFWYRRNKASMLNATLFAANRMRSFRPFLDALPAPLAELAMLAFSTIEAKRVSIQAPDGDIYAQSDEDYEFLRTSDPDDPSTIVLVAKTLVNQGSTELALSLIKDLESQDKSVSLTAEMTAVQLMLAGTRGDFNSLETLINELTERSRPGLTLADACALGLASINIAQTPKNLLIKLSEKLIAGKPDSICAQLDTCLAYAYSGATDLSLERFQDALRLANDVYLRRRPDVAVAIIRNEFTSGLAHFCTYGHKENAAWPERTKFIKTCQQLDKLVSSNGNKGYFGLTRFFIELDSNSEY